MVIIRKPAAAGSFYPRFKSELRSSIEQSFHDKDFGPDQDLIIGSEPLQHPRRVLGGICPHAGYTYSGPAVACTIQEIFRDRAPDTILILGTQHTGYYKIGLMKEGVWETPLGQIEIDTAIAQDLLANSSVIIDDDSAFNGYPHGREHNIEVQLPFIQYAAELGKKLIKIVPIKVGSMQIADLQHLAKAIAKTIQSHPEKDIAVFASSDMTHFQPANARHPDSELQEKQYKRDMAVIDAFQANLWDQTYSHARKTTVCGPQTIATLMLIARELEYEHPKVLKYYTSYEKLGKKPPCDYSVGYFAGTIEK
jgi:hypothetical protein